MVKKSGPAFRCGECGAVVAKWFGRCPECQAWGTIEEVAAARPALAKVVAGAPASPARPIAEVDVESARAQRTGVPELDRVLGGGLVPGAVVLLAGEPGVGKSTLLLEVAYQWVAREDSPGRALYITGEESAGQVRLRAERTGNVHREMFLASESDLATVIGHVDAVKPAMLVIDSVQTMSSPAVESSAGGVTQVRAVTAALVALAKERSLPVILVGHVTKEGSVAGPRVLEHLVDVVLQFEGDKYSSLRLVRGVKNRFGAADEVGCFEMVEEGIVGVPDPSGIFMSNRVEGVAGTAVTVITEGKRALLGEVQALVANTEAPMPRRAVNGLEASRVAKVLAVLERRASLPLGKSDVFTATVGGMRIIEPAGDLALAMAVASAKLDIPLPNDMVIIGEVGLAGEVRRVGSVGRRLAEAARLGFKRALIPPDSGRLPPEIRATVVPDLRTLVDTLSKR